MKMLICLVGLPGSGKSSALEYAKDFGPVVVMGDVVRDEALKRNLKITPETLGQVAKDLRKKGGPDVIAERTIVKIQQLDGGVVFVDGIRSLHELELFKQNFPKVVLVSVDAPKEQRFKWLSARKRGDDPKTLADFKTRDAREIEFGVKEVMDLAEYQLFNKGSLDDLKNDCQELFQSLMRVDYSADDE
jgi:dephospho-CoA kinase